MIPDDYEELYRLFEKELQLLRNPTCLSCDAVIRHPLLPWHVGQHYWTSTERLLLVGKPHRGTPGVIRESGIIDPRVEAQKYFLRKDMAYWSYSRAIAVRIYGDPTNAWDNIAMTNLVKCTNVDYPGPTADSTTFVMASRCILDLRVIVREIQLLKPRHIVFYTYSFFSSFLRDLRFESGATWRDITSREHRVECGGKRLGWWERSCSTSWCENLRVLVVGHPERKLKREYVELVGTWVEKGGA
jgi:hypothetical protein